MNPSSAPTQMPSSLGFSRLRSSREAQKSCHLSRHDAWDRGYQYQRVIRWSLAAGRRSVRSSGHDFMQWVLIGLMLALGAAATATVLANESLLLQLEQRSRPAAS